MGGHFMFDDDQETPNTLTATFEFDEGGKKKMLVFEVRHWIIQPRSRHRRRRPFAEHRRSIFYGSKGMVAIWDEDHGKYHTYLGKEQTPGPSGANRGRQLGQLHRRAAQPQALGPERADRRGRHLDDAGAPGQHLLPPGPHAALRCRHVLLPGGRRSQRMFRRKYRAPFVVPEVV